MGQLSQKTKPVVRSPLLNAPFVSTPQKKYTIYFHCQKRLTINATKRIKHKRKRNAPGISGTMKMSICKSQEKLNLGTWNVRNLYEAGKLANIVQEMKRLKINILGISETWWPNSGKCETDDVTYTGNTSAQHRNQIDFILINKRFSSSICHVLTYPGAD